MNAAAAAASTAANILQFIPVANNGAVPTNGLLLNGGGGGGTPVNGNGAATVISALVNGNHNLLPVSASNDCSRIINAFLHESSHSNGGGAADRVAVSALMNGDKPLQVVGGQNGNGLANNNNNNDAMDTSNTTQVTIPKDVSEQLIV